MIKWFVILTIGCLPVEQQPPGANCAIPTTITEVNVSDEAAARRIRDSLVKGMPEKFPGSFAVARIESRKVEKK